MEHTGKGYLNINGKVKEVDIDESDLMSGMKVYNSHESAIMDGTVDNAKKNFVKPNISFDKFDTNIKTSFNVDRYFKWTDNNISEFLEGVKIGKVKPKSSGHKKNKELTSFSFPDYFCEIHVHWKDDKMEIIAKSHIKDLRTKKRIKAVLDTYTIAMLRHFSGLDDKQKENPKFKGTKSKSSEGIKSNQTTIRSNKFTNQNFNIMGNIQSYQLQLEQLERLKNYLSNFNLELLNRSMEYQRMVDLLYESGLPQETYNKFQADHLDATKNNIQQIVSIIENNSIPFIMSNIELTISQLERNR